MAPHGLSTILAITSSVTAGSRRPPRSGTKSGRAPEAPQGTTEEEERLRALMIIPSSLSELRSFGLYALRRKMYSPHLKPLNTLNQTQKRGILRQGRALNNLRRLRQSTASTGLLKRVTLSGRALLCDFFRDGRLPVGGSRGHREGLSVFTQHMRCAEGLRLPP